MIGISTVLFHGHLQEIPLVEIDAQLGTLSHVQVSDQTLQIHCLFALALPSGHEFLILQFPTHPLPVLTPVDVARSAQEGLEVISRGIGPHHSQHLVDLTLFPQLLELLHFLPDAYVLLHVREVPVHVLKHLRHRLAVPHPFLIQLQLRLQHLPLRRRHLHATGLRVVQLHLVLNHACVDVPPVEEPYVPVLVLQELRLHLQNLLRIHSRHVMRYLQALLVRIRVIFGSCQQVLVLAQFRHCALVVDLFIGTVLVDGRQEVHEQWLADACLGLDACLDAVYRVPIGVIGSSPEFVHELSVSHHLHRVLVHEPEQSHVLVVYRLVPGHILLLPVVLGTVCLFAGERYHLRFLLAVTDDGRELLSDLLQSQLRLLRNQRQTAVFVVAGDELRLTRGEKHGVREQHLTPLDLVVGRQHVLDQLHECELFALQQPHVHLPLHFELVPFVHLGLAYLTPTSKEGVATLVRVAME